MPPRYTLGLNLENEDDYQGGLSRAVEEALLPSVSQEVAAASEPAYSFDGPKINLGELQDSTPAATEDTVAETNYLAQLMGQANEVKALREKASTLAAQELSPEQSIASAILSAVPALLGLAAAGKRGFVGAGSVSGPAGALYAEARRKDMLEQSKQVGSQADALQQALNLDRKERAAEDRLTRQFEQQDKRDRARREADKIEAENKATAEQIKTQKKALREASALGLKPKLDPETNLPYADNDARKAAIGTLTNAISLIELADSFSQKYDKASPSDKASLRAEFTALVKDKSLLNLGAALTATEMVNVLGFLPQPFSARSFINPAEVLTWLQQNFDEYGGKQAAEAIKRLAARNTYKAVSPYYDIEDDNIYSSLKPLIANKYDSSPDNTGLGIDKNALEASLIKRGAVKNAEGKWEIPK